MRPTGLDELRRRGLTVEIVRERVTGYGHEDGVALLETATGRHRADHVAVCVGTAAAPDHYGLAGLDGFVADPYPLATTLSTVSPDQDVTVLGSGLSAVDVVASLQSLGHRGSITLASRSGVLPFVQQRARPVEFQHLTKERLHALRDRAGELTLADLAPLLRAELQARGQDFTVLEQELRETYTEPPVDRLRRQIDAIDSPHMGRRLLVRAVRSLGPAALRLLSPAALGALRERHFRVLSSLCAPMVPLNARLLLRLFDSGRLTLATGLQKIESTAGGGFQVVTESGELRADVVVNAVNAAPHSAPSTAAPLFSALVASGVAGYDGTGGLVSASPTVHTLGDFTGGGLFITSSMAGLVARAQGVVAALHAA
ncbi:hypothetical protein QWJ26_27595 [Streptomyces sp. CSDS2]|uniref:FAD/NAD(P)-binding protein n=1 Tax=Streptomyces sp. CSDS2 TaxID=3055051 RepID=UPI0025B0A91C|nr:hypothetical protein [Streptomyces sp. CSDS2]MDN3263510.1 hypothetical protein [Streptomyces sp. CSDS2]